MVTGQVKSLLKLIISVRDSINIPLFISHKRYFILTVRRTITKTAKNVSIRSTEIQATCPENLWPPILPYFSRLEEAK